MKTIAKRISIIIAFSVILCVIFTSNALSGFADYDGVATRINNLSTKFPDGKYWNHYVTDPYDQIDYTGKWTWDYADCLTDNPCTTHNATATTGYYDCNCFDGGAQCWGFANRLYYEVFNILCSDSENTTTHYDKWAIQPGDHVRLSYDHSVFVKERNGDIITIIECNNGNTCRIGWNRTLNINDFSIQWVKHANNWDEINRTHQTSVILDVNGMLDGATSGWVDSYATFDVYINGSRVKNDVNDYCDQVSVGSSYEIKDIKVADGKAFDGFSSYAAEGHVSGGRTGTVNSNTDVRLQLHTVNAAGYTQAHAPASISTYNGHSYYFYNSPVTWYDAKTICEYLGGHLVTITGSAEENFIKGMIGNSDLWLGATDKDSEGNWKWITGESFSYNNWESGQPDNTASLGEGTEDYAHIWGSTGKWNDNAGCVPYPFVCEIDRAYKVSYNANGGNNDLNHGIILLLSTPKAVGQSVNITAQTPRRSSYTFLGWATDPYASTPEYQPGDTYSTDANLNLYAVWERIGNTITYNANGGENPPAEQFKAVGETITLSPEVPTRTGYTFLGWGTSASATTPSYQPGARYSADADLTLYALWRITNPPTLRGKNVTMLAGDTRDLADFVELTHDGVLSYTLTATAGGVVSLNGQWVTATAPGSGALIVSVAEYPAATCTVSINVVDLSATLRLPAALTEIGNEAFENCGAAAITISSGCENIGSRAFADNPGLVYILIPASVTQIAADAFADSPNVTVYCYSGSAAAAHAAEHSIRHVLLSDGWVLADALPLGATVTDEQWTYQKATTETTTSTALSMDGWTQSGFTWQQTGSGTHTYAYFPEGFDTGHSLYSAYAKSALTNNETATTKRTVFTNEIKNYIYWHWTWFWGSSENKLISDCYCVEDGREYDNFKAYENGYIEYVSGQNYVNWDRGGDEDGSCWWFRFDVYRQTYADYQKLFTYTRTVTSEESSAVPVTEGNGISNVQHWVKYTL